MIKVISSGIFTTIQDQGRFGYRKYGVPISGPMDVLSANNANSILKNSATCAILEFMLQGPILKFNQAATIAICGAADSPTLNDLPVLLNKPIKINKGDILKTGRCRNGMYGYLSVLGGFLGEKVLGSRAYYNGISAKPRIKKMDILLFNNMLNETCDVSPTVQLIDLSLKEIIAFKGPDFKRLNATIKKALEDATFTVSSEISRMGYRIDANISLSANEIITAPVQPGTIQLTPSGKLIALMSDCQTTGGYARILQLPAESRAILAQKRTGKVFTLKLVDELSLHH